MKHIQMKSTYPKFMGCFIVNYLLTHQTYTNSNSNDDRFSGHKDSYMLNDGGCYGPVAWETILTAAITYSI